VDGFEALGGSDHDDELRGTDGPDQIESGAGNDVLDGRGGDDILYGMDGDDTYVGGDGRDLVSFSFAASGVEVDLLARTASGEGEDDISEVEVLDGSRFDDTIRGGAADELLIGRDGNDTLSGGAGNDVLWGEFSGMTAESYERVGLTIERTKDDLDGGPGTDELHGGPGDNRCTNGEELEDC
jgi:Ca2+-binding RTX toxin-like protein